MKSAAPLLPPHSESADHFDRRSSSSSAGRDFVLTGRPMADSLVSDALFKDDSLRHLFLPLLEKSGGGASNLVLAVGASI